MPLVAVADSVGLDWLLLQQQADGRIATPADETGPHHASFEALRTLVELRAPDTARADAAAFVSADSIGELASLARHLRARHLSGNSAGAVLSDLTAYQNPDGGFAAYPGEQSRVLDTLDALETLRDLGADDPMVVGPALGFLRTQQLPDGAFASNEASPGAEYLTARAVSLFWHHRLDFPLAASLEAAAGFLWSRQRNGLWGSAATTAHALLALVPSTWDVPRLASAVDGLRERRNPDGSWEGSVYSTALVLRALSVFTQQAESDLPEDEIFRGHWATDPADLDPGSFPNLGVPSDGTTTIFGIVRDRSDGAAIPNALVTMADVSVQTDADGRYRVEGVVTHELFVRAAAMGYRLQSTALDLTGGTGLFRLDIALDAVSIDGVEVRGLWIGRDEYQAFEDVPVSLEIANRGEREQRLVLAARVQGMSSGFREDFLIPAPGGARDDRFVLAPGQIVEHEFSWFTRNLPPQEYRVSVQILSEDRRNVLSQASRLIRVVPTERLSSLALEVLPRELVHGASVDVDISARIRNASNIDTRLEMTVTVVSPAGEEQLQERVTVDVHGDAVEQTTAILSFAQDFTEAGIYRVLIHDFVGSAPASVTPARIDVAPNLRVEGALEIQPSKIPPGSTREVRIRLSIEGMEDAL